MRAKAAFSTRRFGTAIPFRAIRSKRKWAVWTSRRALFWRATWTPNSSCGWARTSRNRGATKIPTNCFGAPTANFCPRRRWPRRFTTGTRASSPRAVIRHAQNHEWADKIIGYANFLRMEGTHEPILTGDLFDHSAPMLERWRAVSDEPLPRSWSEFSHALYFRGWGENARLRRYLELLSELFGQQFRALCAAMDDAREGRPQFLVYDALKIAMTGWNNLAFFDPAVSWQAYPEDRAGSGHLNVAPTAGSARIRWFDHASRLPGARRGRRLPARRFGRQLRFARQTVSVRDGHAHLARARPANFPARDAREFEAVTWRNVATTLAGGYASYPMDVYEDWFAGADIHRTLARQGRSRQQVAPLAPPDRARHRSGVGTTGRFTIPTATARSRTSRSAGSGAAVWRVVACRFAPTCSMICGGIIFPRTAFYIFPICIGPTRSA